MNRRFCKVENCNGVSMRDGLCREHWIEEHPNRKDIGSFQDGLINIREELSDKIEWGKPKETPTLSKPQSDFIIHRYQPDEYQTL